MSIRYETGGPDTEIGVAYPGDTDSLWDGEFPSEGRHALIIGNPWASAYAIVGTPEQLRDWVSRAAALLYGV